MHPAAILFNELGLKDITFIKILMLKSLMLSAFFPKLPKKLKESRCEVGLPLLSSPTLLRNLLSLNRPALRLGLTVDRRPKKISAQTGDRTTVLQGSLDWQSNALSIELTGPLRWL